MSAYQISQTISALTTSPNKDTMTESEFEAAMDTRMSQEPTFYSQIVALIVQLNLLSTNVNTNSTEAESSSELATAAANYIGNWDDQTGAHNSPTSVTHDGQHWLLNTDVADITAKEPGVDSEWTSITPNMVVRSKTQTGTLLAWECNNSMIENYGQAAIMTLTLPTGESGLGFILNVSTTTYAIHVKAGAGNKLYLDGVALDVGDKASLLTPSIGDCLTVWTVRNGAGTWDWFARSGPAIWVDGGA